MSDAPAVRRVRAAALAVGVEAVALAVFGMVEFARLDSDRPTVALTTGAFFVLYAVGLALAARALWHLRSWARGPVVLAQLIQLGVAWSFYGNDTHWLALLLAVAAIGTLVVVLAPATTALLYRGAEAEDGDTVSSG